MAQMAKFAVSHFLLHELLHLPENCRIVLVAEGEMPETLDIFISSPDFPEAEVTPRIKPVFEKRAPIALKDWGFPVNRNGR